MWQLDCKASWALKNWCFWTVVLEKTLESPLDCKKFQPVNPKGNQSWIFTGTTDAEAETPILWPPDARNWLIWKDPDAGKDWRWEEKGTTEDEMVEWHHQLNGHEQMPLNSSLPSFLLHFCTECSLWAKVCAGCRGKCQKAKILIFMDLRPIRGMRFENTSRRKPRELRTQSSTWRGPVCVCVCVCVCEHRGEMWASAESFW